MNDTAGWSAYLLEWALALNRLADGGPRVDPEPPHVQVTYDTETETVDDHGLMLAAASMIVELARAIEEATGVDANGLLEHMKLDHELDRDNTGD